MSTRNPSLLAAMRAVVSDELADVWTAIPGRIVKIATDGQTVDVEPSVKRPIDYSASRETNEQGDPIYQETESLPVLPSVPVVYPRAGDLAVSLPLAVGHRVLVVFSMLEAGEWFGAKGDEPVEPGLLDLHSVNGAFAIPGGYPEKDARTDHSTTKIRIGSDGGSWEPIALGTTTDQQLTAIKNDINNLKTALSTWAPVVMDGGTALKAAITTWASTTLTVSSVEASDVEVT